MRQLQILAPTRYPWRFNGPRHSRHRITNRDFVPFNRLSSRLEGITVLNAAGRRFDLVHAFNRIPLGSRPFVIGFESHLPRLFETRSTRLGRWLWGLLASGRCRAVVPISRYAHAIFLKFCRLHDADPCIPAKVRLRYPNVVVPEPAQEFHCAALPIELTFVGHHFARKGGCVAVRVAEMARDRDLPVRVTVVSRLEMGGGIWTDPLRPGFFDRYRRLLDAPNVVHHATLPNEGVQDLLRNSHLSLLPTFGDTFGYSVIESMAHGTPAVVTRQAALPEFVHDRENGALLDLPLNDEGDWVHSSSPARGEEGFERMFADEVDRLAEDALAAVLDLCSSPDRLRQVRDRARETARDLFSSRPASLFWDDLYDGAAEGP